jgi:hypothetical protein
MKLSACYSVYDGLELLDKSISQIYESVDVIILCWQRISWNGILSNEIVDFIRKYDDGKIQVVEFICDPSINPKINEINKHNLMLQTARSFECTHFFMSATDHFYDKNQFEKYKTIAESYDVTFTKMFTYYKYANWQLIPMEEYLMPWIIRIYPHTIFQKVNNYPAYIDPSLKVNTYENNKVFEPEEIVMHHYSMVRKSIKEKLMSSASLFRFGLPAANEFVNDFENYDLELNPGVKYFNGRKIKVVDNYFTIDVLV